MQTLGNSEQGALIWQQLQATQKILFNLKYMALTTISLFISLFRLQPF